MSNSKGEITRRRILQVISDFISSYHYPPTLQKIKNLAGIRSFDAVGRHLKVLKEQGFIDWEDGLSHKIRMTNKHIFDQEIKERV